MGKREIEKCMDSFRELVVSIRNGQFAPFYVITGEEPYYADFLIKEIEQRALTPEEKGFNMTVVYGSDISSAGVVEASRRYPMMAQRQVVIVKEAQRLDKIDTLGLYFVNPLQSTVLVLAFNGKSLDKRTSLYKNAVKNGVVLETYSLYPEMVGSWIEKYIKAKDVKISPEASLLMAEYCGTEMRKLAMELDKLMVNIPQGKGIIDVSTVEENTGISREFSVFELTKAISFKDTAKAIKIVRFFGASPRQYPLVLTLAALFNHFSRILKYHAILSRQPSAQKGQIASFLGINPYFMPEYEHSAKNFPLIKCMEAISHIRKYDSMSKSNKRGGAEDGDLLFELVFKILH
ncbi:MAG: DNA polymerase III subunit delta [Bacteroidales bacterium]|jgi:DNA polymerase-3 subunit delta